MTLVLADSGSGWTAPDRLALEVTESALIRSTADVAATLAVLRDAGVDKDYRGREKASDHAPTWIDLH